MSEKLGEPITVRLPEEIEKFIRDNAKSERRTVTAMTRIYIEDRVGELLKNVRRR